ncbi:unnamed protein product [Effrenium voratum]|uniref:Uncharacterized protein n=1 Tax=Effrenium voratum TaxID=2562239 RepID=A0AA36JI65_9DINO|nr:unnamed protein product [Effrenium voratum]
MSTRTASVSSHGSGKGVEPAKAAETAKQVEEYIKVSKETSQVAYELACIAQDLGSLGGTYNDEKSLEADRLIGEIVGDRIPYTFGKRGSDTIPAGLSALSQFFAEDPRHFGIRLSALFTGGNFIQERRKYAVGAPLEPGSDSDESSSSSGSSSSGSAESTDAITSVASGDLETFDAAKWHHDVDSLLHRIQGKEEWETMAALREGYIFKDLERAADLVHIEAMAEMNDDELKGFDKTREELDTQVEAKQLDMLQTLSSFNDSLKKTTRDIIMKRRARRKAARKRFSFSNMDEVVLVKKNEQDSEDETSSAVGQEVQEVKGSKAGELLSRIAELQKGMNELVSDNQKKKLTLNVHNKALLHLKSALEATERGEEAPEATEEIQELLQQMQQKAKDESEAEKRAAADARIREAAQDSKLSEEYLLKLPPAELKVHLSKFEDDVQLLQSKEQELSKQAQNKTGEAAKKARKAAQAFSQAVGGSGQAPGSTPTRGSATRLSSSIDPDVNRKRTTGLELAPQQLLQALEQQLPAARKALQELEIYHRQFLESIDKAQRLREQLSLDPSSERTSVVQVDESDVPRTVVAPAAPTPASPVRARRNSVRRRNSEAEAGAGAAQTQEPRPRRPSVANGGSTQPLSEAKVEELQLAQDLAKSQEEMRRMSRRLSQALGMPAETVQVLAPEVGDALLEDKKAELKQKQDQAAELRAELEQLQPPERTKPPEIATAVSPESVTSDPGGLEDKSPKSPRRRMSLFERRASFEELAKNGHINPELMQQLLHEQGETIQIQQQLASIEDLIKVIRSKGGDITASEKQKIKDMFGKAEIKNVEQLSQAQELKDERKKIKELEQQVVERRSEWSSIEGVSKALKGLAEGNLNHADILKKVRAVNAAHLRTGLAETGSTNNSEMATLQAAAAMARSDPRRRKSEQMLPAGWGPVATDRPASGPSPAGPAGPATQLDSPRRRTSFEDLLGPRRSLLMSPALSGFTSKSGSHIEVDELMTPSPQPRSLKRGPSLNTIEGFPGEVPMQAVVNSRRRHSLTTGMAATRSVMESPRRLAMSGEEQRAPRSLVGTLGLSPRRFSVA